jgi:hypothetical protein
MALKLEESLEEIDTTTMPDLMTKPEALAWLEQMIDELKSRCEALREEIANET